ncbi:MAG: hypothetical protein ACRDHD_00045 [Candidatus Limnocylindria bacterium]
MNPEQMDQLISAHLTAEVAGDVAGCLAAFADDMEHDLVGSPDGPLYGRKAAEAFYA